MNGLETKPALLDVVRDGSSASTRMTALAGLASTATWSIGCASSRAKSWAELSEVYIPIARGERYRRFKVSGRKAGHHDPERLVRTPLLDSPSEASGPVNPTQVKSWPVAWFPGARCRHLAMTSCR